MPLLPIFLTDQQPIFLIGGGDIAARKLRLLRGKFQSVYFFADTHSDEMTIELQYWAAQSTHIHAYKIQEVSTILAKKAPVAAIIAVDDPKDIKASYVALKAKNVLVNVVDQPDLCDFNIGSLVTRGDLSIGISTNGNAPVLGRQLRAKLEQELPQGLDEKIDKAADLRPNVADVISADQRKEFWAWYFAQDHINHLSTDEIFDKFNAQHDMHGRVSIVGAGPGDPELLTLKAARLLDLADVILYDNLVSDAILNMSRRDATRIYVGKKQANHAMTQEDIGALLVKLAHQGKHVVRLKGGDPFIFGRGGEELDALRAAGLDADGTQIDIVPGITAALGAAAQSGVALTHRDHASAVTFITGHGANDQEPKLDYAALANSNATLVVYMGLKRAKGLVTKFTDAGMRPDMPVAIIEKATHADQFILKTTLIDMPRMINEAQMDGPAILIIGEVAQMAQADLLALSARHYKDTSNETPQNTHHLQNQISA